MHLTSRRRDGDKAEAAAAGYLEARGYRICDRNFSCRYGELDLVAEHGQTLCFVEVRMRASSVWGDPSQTVMSSKQHRVVKTALHYLQANSVRDRMIRFDVISVVGQGATARVEHIPNAFDAGM